MAELLYKEEVFAIVGAAMEVYNELGSGFLEAVNQEALEMELSSQDIPFAKQQELVIHYKGRKLEKTYLCDFLCFEKIIVEIKAADALTGVDIAQLLNYLKATGFRVGVLINFGDPAKLSWKRFIR